MHIGELRQHPDYPKLLAGLQKKLDITIDLVVRAGVDDDIEKVRKHAPNYTLLVELLDELSVKEK